MLPDVVVGCDRPRTCFLCISSAVLLLDNTLTDPPFGSLEPIRHINLLATDFFFKF